MDMCFALHQDIAGLSSLIALKDETLSYVSHLFNESNSSTFGFAVLQGTLHVSYKV